MLLERQSDHDEGSWMMKNQKKLGKKWIEKGLAGLSSQKKMLLCPWIGAVQCKGCNYDLNSTKSMKMQEITGKGRVKSRNDR